MNKQSRDESQWWNPSDEDSPLLTVRVPVKKTMNLRDVAKRTVVPEFVYSFFAWLSGIEKKKKGQ